MFCVDKGQKISRRSFLGIILSSVVGGKDSRVIELANLHTREYGRIEYYRNGKYVRDEIIRGSYLLRDHYKNKAVLMDVGLFEILHVIKKYTGVGLFFVVSGYRTLETNEMLRRRDPEGVAKNSYHIRGQAVDVRITDINVVKFLWYTGICGLGVYRNFIHIDTGRGRRWVRI